MTIERILVLSTGHVTKHDINLIDNRKYPATVMQHPGGHGCMLYVGDDNEDASPVYRDKLAFFSLAFVRVIERVKASGCHWLLLDGDGEVDDTLVTFDW